MHAVFGTRIRYNDDSKSYRDVRVDKGPGTRMVDDLMGCTEALGVEGDSKQSVD